MSQETHSGYRRFLKLLALAGVSLGFLMFLGNSAWGSPAHVHKGVSPFEGKSQHKNPHCLLNKHEHHNLPCPHTLLRFPINEPGFFISVECGGSRQGSLPAKTGFDHNPGMTASSLLPTPLNSCEARSGDILSRAFHLPNSLDHPPQSV